MEQRWDQDPEGFDRREFLSHLAAAFTLGTSACNSHPAQNIVPYARRPIGVLPGVPQFYATSMVFSGFAVGLVVESHQGRPTKVEGNPDHPASLGASGAQEQAAVFSLYDPNRLRSVQRRGIAGSFQAFARAFLGTERPGSGPRPDDRGRGLHFLLEPTSSTIVAGAIAAIRRRLPEARFHFYDPLAPIAQDRASRIAFGRPLVRRLLLDRARVILDLDEDLLDQGPFRLRYARQFADGRRLYDGLRMNRLYSVETTFSPTGASADHRLAVKSSRITNLTAAITAEVAKLVGPAIPASLSALLERNGEGSDPRFVRAVARDLVSTAGQAAIAGGTRQPEEVALLVHLLDDLLGTRGAAVELQPSPILEAGEDSHGLQGLAVALERGEVDRLLILGGNPAYTAPADLDFGARIGAARLSAKLGSHVNETALRCEWRLPELHFLESWGDARAFDGTASVIQPLIEPLFGGSTVADVLAIFSGDDRSPRDRLRAAWGMLPPAPASPEELPVLARAGDRGWIQELEWIDRFDRALRLGLLAGSAFAASPLPLSRDRVFASLEAALASKLEAARSVGLELSLIPDPRVRDGSFSNNAWLLELPDPLTKLVWGNAALIAPSTARMLGVKTGDQLRIRAGEQRVEAPAFILPGQAEGSLTLSLGYGRVGEEALARGIGANAYRLRTQGAPWFRFPVEVERIGAGDPTGPLGVVVTQPHLTQTGHPTALISTLSALGAGSAVSPELRTHPPSLRAEWPQTSPQWGMTVDLNVCTGCSACVVACQAENNVPFVGKLEVHKSREMYWLRVDRYFAADGDPSVVMQPMACQHCEHAPCEYVCPVNATVHSDDGLNEMVYNRCVGTRFCSNNCPYKVRRFNWFDYAQKIPELASLAMNPEVTVRARGVMEKCSYCVQRIRRAEILARTEGRALRDGDVITACQQACPTRAIQFGDVADPQSLVARLREDPRAYAALHHTGARPRTYYLAKIRNLNPELTAPEVAGA